MSRARKQAVGGISQVRLQDAFSWDMLQLVLRRNPVNHAV
jgi:hypothetical protein